MRPELTKQERKLLWKAEKELKSVRNEMQAQGYPLWHDIISGRVSQREFNRCVLMFADLEAEEVRRKILGAYRV